MKRRLFLTHMCGAFAARVIPAGLAARGSTAAYAAATARTVAGVPIVDSAIATRALELARETYPAYLLNHAMRTYLFGSLIGRAAKLRFDAEVLFLGCLMHDFGLTPKYEGDEPFEIQGAIAAKTFLLENKFDTAKADIVWDGIAMHPLAIASYKRPEISLVSSGAGADVLAADLENVSNADIAAVLHSYPRMQFETAFVRSCADIVRRHPGGAGRTFMRDIGEREVPGYHPTNICDLIREAKFPS